MRVLPYGTAAEVAAAASGAVDDGYTAVKVLLFQPEHHRMPLARRIADLVDRTAILRETLGPDVDLAVELHRNMGPGDSLLLMDQLARFHPIFVEDPLPPDSVLSLGEVARKARVPLAAGERNTTIREFREYIEHGGFDVVRPDVGIAGGITHVREICALAEAHHLLSRPAKGKDFDGAHVLGPWLVTADEIPDPYALTMRALVNGEEWTTGSTGDMHWRFEDMIAHASSAETLRPLEVFGSGAVGGGSAAELGTTLHAGDVVELSVDGLGVLRTRSSPVIRPAGRRPDKSARRGSLASSGRTAHSQGAPLGGRSRVHEGSAGVRRPCPGADVASVCRRSTAVPSGTSSSVDTMSDHWSASASWSSAHASTDSTIHRANCGRAARRMARRSEGVAVYSSWFNSTIGSDITPPLGLATGHQYPRVIYVSMPGRRRDGCPPLMAVAWTALGGVRTCCSRTNGAGAPLAGTGPAGTRLRRRRRSGLFVSADVSRVLADPRAARKT